MHTTDLKGSASTWPFHKIHPVSYWPSLPGMPLELGAFKLNLVLDKSIIARVESNEKGMFRMGRTIDAVRHSLMTKSIAHHGF